MAAVLAMLLPWAFAQQVTGFGTARGTASSNFSSGPFDKIWTVPLSQFDQSDQWADSITQLQRGTLVAAGADGGIQPNSCDGFVGGAWVIAVTPGGDPVSQSLYSNCSNAQQWANFVRATADGGFISSGEDDSTTACQPCAWTAKFSSSGGIVWQEDLKSFFGSGLNLKPTSDGGYIGAGYADPTAAQPIRGFVAKLSGGGVAEWSALFTETANSFPGAVVNQSGGLNFNSIAATADGGYVISGVADARFSSGFAHVLVLMKLSRAGNVQWARAYYGNIWGSWDPGDSLQYPVFPTSDGGYVVSGTVQTLSSPYETLFFLMHVDAQGNVLWQKGYGGENGYYMRSEAIGASLTSDGGYILAGESNVFLQEFDGWMVKTDADGNIQWQRLYTGTEPMGSNAVTLRDVIETRDGGYAAAGPSYVGSLSYGGPGFLILKTDAQGNVGTCDSCSQQTHTTVQSLDLQPYDAQFPRTQPALVFDVTNMQPKKTSAKPISLYP